MWCQGVGHQEERGHPHSEQHLPGEAGLGWSSVTAGLSRSLQCVSLMEETKSSLGGWRIASRSVCGGGQGVMGFKDYTQTSPLMEMRGEGRGSPQAITFDLGLEILTQT